MTDEVQKIREEVERMRNLHQMKYQQLETDNKMCLVECGKRNLCNDLLYFIDSLQEEPVNAELEDTTQTITYEGEVYTRCYKDKLDAFACKYPMSVPKPSKRYAKYSDVDLTIAVKEGAKWQKEQMMKDAIEIEGGEFHLNFANAIISKGTAPFEKCKVKMIIIKED